MPAPERVTKIVSKVDAEALACLEESDGDVRQAVALMVQHVQEDDQLREELIAPLLRNACYTAITSQCRKLRLKVWSSALDDHEKNKAGLVAVSAENLRGLMDFPLPGGLRLGSANRSQVMSAAEMYDRQGLDMRYKASWLRLVGQGITGTRVVAECLNEKRLIELQLEAQKYI